MLNWAGSLTISSYLVIREGWTAKTKVQTFFGTQIATFPGNVAFWVQWKTGHSNCNVPWERCILSAGEIRNLLKNIHMYLWNQVFSPLKLNCSLGRFSLSAVEKKATQNATYPGNVSFWVRVRYGICWKIYICISGTGFSVHSKWTIPWE